MVVEIFCRIVVVFGYSIFLYISLWFICKNERKEKRKRMEIIRFFNLCQFLCCEKILKRDTNV